MYAVALCIETNLLIHFALNKPPFYLFIFFCTCIYYTMIYVRSIGARNWDERTLWYRKHIRYIKIALYFFIAAALILAVYILNRNRVALFLLSPLQVAFIVAFPLVAGWYTFSPTLFRLPKIRQVGWIKPFIVGFTWAGWVTVYPVLLLHIQQGNPGFIHLFSFLLLFVQNFLFFSINAIIFDVKDYRTDFLHRLKTFPVVFGVKKTFRLVLAPLIIVNLVVFFIFQWQQDFSVYQSLVQLIPYLLLIIVTITYREQRSVLYYLVAVDGLVFVKAICGITSVLFLKK